MKKILCSCLCWCALALVAAPLSADEESGFRRIDEDKTEALLPFAMRLSLMRSKGETSVSVYDNNDRQIADGKADYREYFVSLGYDPVQSSFYLGPSLGFLYRTVNVKDFSSSLDAYNSDKAGFIPGIVSDPDSGQIYDKNSISSLRYEAEFLNVFCDIKAGYNLVLGWSSFQVMLQPYLAMSLAEVRKSEYSLQTLRGEETWKVDQHMAFLDSYAGGLALGVYLPDIRTGILVGAEYRYIRHFYMPEDLRFKELWHDDNLGITRTRETGVDYCSVRASLTTVTIFFML
jgi:hypothetical protein